MCNVKMNNLHFGRHVFDYFPWYKYSSDINTDPTLNQSVLRVFDYAFADMHYGLWRNTTGENRAGLPYMYRTMVIYKKDDVEYLVLEGNISSYKGIEEEVYDWEDVEKSHLRYFIGTRKYADQYFEVISLYNKYYDIIKDSVCLAMDVDDTLSEDLHITNMYDFVNRSQDDIIREVVEDQVIYDMINAGKLHGSGSFYSDFIPSVCNYYKKNGFLSVKQIEAIKKIMYKPIGEFIGSKPFFFMKTDNMSHKGSEHITSYLSETTPLKFKKFREFTLIYE